MKSTQSGSADTLSAEVTYIRGFGVFGRVTNLGRERTVMLNQVQVLGFKREKKINELIGPRPVSPRAPQGLYLYGNVGCGRRNIFFVFFQVM